MGLLENADVLYKFREHIDQWVIDNNAEPKYGYQLIFNLFFNFFLSKFVMVL